MGEVSELFLRIAFGAVAVGSLHRTLLARRLMRADVVPWATVRVSAAAASVLGALAVGLRPGYALWGTLVCTVSWFVYRAASIAAVRNLPDH